MRTKYRERNNGLFSLIDNISRKFFKIFCHFIKKAPSEATEDSFVQFIKFGIVGVTNTVISYIVYLSSLIALKKLKINEDYLVAQILSFVLGVLWSFYWNNRYVFDIKDGQKRSLWMSLLKTYISYSFTGLFLSSAMLVIWVKALKISKFIAPIINLIVTVPLNFIINKFWAFKTKKDK